MYIPHHIQRFATRDSASTRWLGTLVRMNRLVLAGAIVSAIVIPELFHPMMSDYIWARNVQPNEPSLYVATVALIMAHFLLHKTSTLAKANDKALVIPAMTCSFVAATLFLFVTVGKVSYYHVVTGFGIGCIWYLSITVLRNRLSEPRLAFVGEMQLDDSLLLTRIEWCCLRSPALPKDVQAIVFDKRQPVPEAYARLFSRSVLRSIPVYELADLREMITGRVRLDARPEEVFGKVLPSQPYLRIKPVLEALLMLPTLVVVLPVILVFAVLIRLESPGAAIFRQERVGYQGRRFICYKLRSMRHDVKGPAFTTEQDPRITPIGRFIRKTRIDELPQVFNILKGEMSLIGPRPEAVSLGRDYLRQIPYYEYRHLVRPGIAGWAAVHQGNVALEDAARLKLEYDFYYIKNLSIWLDFVIVLLTIRTVMTGFGSR